MVKRHHLGSRTPDRLLGLLRVGIHGIRFAGHGLMGFGGSGSLVLGHCWKSGFGFTDWLGWLVLSFGLWVQPDSWGLGCRGSLLEICWAWADSVLGCWVVLAGLSISWVHGPAGFSASRIVRSGFTGSLGYCRVLVSLSLGCLSSQLVSL
jgi:hypothetical protein